jgi:S-(hydroxymethyl)glutathione dehydrogenase/alcohol dehydrogenase
MSVVRALVSRGRDAQPAVEDIQLPALGPGLVRVRVRAAGVCHSDLSMINGTLSPPFPLVLGHEAAGVVVEVGAGVTHVKPGDEAVLNWSPACRRCWYCANGEPHLCEKAVGPARPGGTASDGTPLHVTLGLGALAEEVVAAGNAVVPVPAGVPEAEAALLGCAVMTGVGAVRHTAAVKPGESVVVIGLGGVGLSVVTAARAAGAAPVIAVDVSEAKRALALSAGATDYLVSDDTLPKAVRGLTGGRGADHAFECVGRSATIQAAWRAARRGGHVTVVGMGALTDMVQLSALDVFHSARVLRSSYYGGSDPDRDVPGLAASVLDGTLNLAPLITDRIRLEDTPAAFERMTRGEGGRSVVIF